jgi:hypothetical protein
MSDIRHFLRAGRGGPIGGLVSVGEGEPAVAPSVVRLVLKFGVNRAWAALRLALLSGGPAEKYVTPLLTAFGPGVEVPTDGGTKWMAAVDRVDLEGRQVAMRLRLMPRARWQEQGAGAGDQPRHLVSRPARGKPLPRRELGPPRKDADLLLHYSFPTALPVNDNLSLFLEYAGNELRRLREDRRPTAPITGGAERR